MLMIAMRSTAIAGADAECHGRGNTGIARLDLWLPVLVAHLKIDLPPERQAGRHAMHEWRALEETGQLLNQR